MFTKTKVQQVITPLTFANKVDQCNFNMLVSTLSHLYNVSVSTPCVTVCVPVLCCPICWLMLIMQMRRRKTTTKSSSVPSTLLNGPGRVSSGEAKDMAAPNPQTATLKRKSHTRPLMFPSHLTSKSRKRGVSHR